MRVQSERAEGACSSQATLLVQPVAQSPQRRDDLSPKRRGASAIQAIVPPAPIAPVGPSAPPEFLKLFRDYRATPGENVALDCVISAIPKPQIVWTYNGEPIAERPGVHITEDGEHYGLLVEKVGERHSGRYAVTAENSSGRATCSALLTILSQPPPASPDSWFVAQPVLMPAAPPEQQQVPAKVAKLFVAETTSAPVAQVPERRLSPTRAPLQQLGPGGAARQPSPPARSVAAARVPQSPARPPEQPVPVAPRFVKLLNDLSAPEGARTQFDAVVEGFQEPNVQVCFASSCLVSYSNRIESNPRGRAEPRRFANCYCSSLVAKHLQC